MGVSSSCALCTSQEGEAPLASPVLTLLTG